MPYPLLKGALHGIEFSRTQSATDGLQPGRKGGSHMGVKESIEAFGLRQVLNYLEDNPQQNIPKILTWLERLDKERSTTASTVSLAE
jgi:hypothetical protein